MNKFLRNTKCWDWLKGAWKFTSPAAINYLPVDTGLTVLFIPNTKVKFIYYQLIIHETDVDNFTNIRLPLFLKEPPNSLALQQQKNIQTLMKKTVVRLYIYLSKWLRTWILHPNSWIGPCSITSCMNLGYLLISNPQCLNL